MIIYNVTTNIEASVHDQWLKWMQTKHIPDVLATKKFISAKLSKVLVDEPLGGFTYSVQYTAKDKTTLALYYKEDAERLRLEFNNLFKDKFVAFRTELEVISEFYYRFPHKKWTLNQKNTSVSTF